MLTHNLILLDWIWLYCGEFMADLGYLRKLCQKNKRQECFQSWLFGTTASPVTDLMLARMGLFVNSGDHWNWDICRVLITFFDRDNPLNYLLAFHSSKVVYALKKKRFVLCVSVLLAACTCACQKRASDHIIDGCEPLCGRWDLNSWPPEEQPCC